MWHISITVILTQWPAVLSERIKLQIWSSSPPGNSPILICRAKGSEKGKWPLLTSDSGRLYWQISTLYSMLALFMALVHIRIRAARRSASASCTRRCTCRRNTGTIKDVACCLAGNLLEKIKLNTFPVNEQPVSLKHSVPKHLDQAEKYVAQLH